MKRIVKTARSRTRSDSHGRESVGKCAGPPWRIDIHSPSHGLASVAVRRARGYNGRAMAEVTLTQAAAELGELLPKIARMQPDLERLGAALLDCWSRRGKALVAGNGGSAADAMHLAEEMVVRFKKNRRALAAMALTDPTAVTCAGNDFGFATIFARQVEAFGNPGDVFIGFTTSGNSTNVLRAFEVAKQQGLVTCGFLGKDGGQARALCDIPLVVPSDSTARIQEGHKLLYHSLCEWVDARVD